MPIYKPSELKQFLEELNISPRKGLSQNFLIDGNIIRKIVETSKVNPGDLILEIGPGPGSLTEALLDKGAHVLAVEKDAVLAKALERLKSDDRKLDIFCEDIMEFRIEEHVSGFLKKGQKAKVIANLPYHLTTPIIAQFVPLRHLFSGLYVMVQDEVARRFTAAPGTSDYSSFTIFLNFYTYPKYAFQVSNHCFYPEPSVQSAIVHLELKEPPNIDNRDHFFELTRTAFSHRRKMLRASLRELYPSDVIMEALGGLGLNPQARPEDLSLDDWLRLFKSLGNE